MKKLIQFGMLAALAHASALAVPVTATFTGADQGPSPSLTFTTTDGDVVVYGRTYAASGWVNSTFTSLVQTHAAGGVGVESPQAPDTGYLVERDATSSEWLFIDFGATSLGGASIDTIFLNYGGFGPPTSPYFYYGWASSVPTSGSSPNPLTAFGNQMTSLTTPFTGLTGTGRYFVIGTKAGQSFAVASLTFTPVGLVPDGASTLALIGAALGAIGLISSRRKL
jgi:hypothetical protein